MTLNISPHCTLQQLGLDLSILHSAISFARQIILSDNYIGSLLENISDTTKPSLEEVKEEINNMNIEIKLIDLAHHLDACALVYRDADPTVIFINPLLLINVNMEKIQVDTWSTEKENLYCLFLGIKILHEFSHLIHPKISESLRRSVKKKKEGGEGKLKTVAPEKLKSNTRWFNNFGEMVEFDLFGGIVELYNINWNESPIAFYASHLIMYAHPTAANGKFIKIPTIEFLISPPVNNLLLEVEESVVDKPYRGPRGYIPIQVSFSVASAGEEDVLERTMVNDVENVEGGVKYARF